MAVQQDTDTALVMSIKQGNIASFEKVFGLYATRLVRYAATLLKNPDEAEDVVQQLFVNLWSKRETLDVRISFRSYLYRAVYNSCMNAIGQQVVRQSHADYAAYTAASGAAEASFAVEEKEINRAAAAAIEALPEQCRLIFRKSRFENLKYQEIADQLGISVKTVENQMGKALRHMREHLKEWMAILILILNCR